MTHALQTFAGVNAIVDALGNSRWSSRENLVSMAHVVSGGRLFELRTFDWSILLVGVTLSGMLVMLF